MVSLSEVSMVVPVSVMVVVSVFVVVCVAHGAVVTRGQVLVAVDGVLVGVWVLHLGGPAALDRLEGNRVVHLPARFEGHDFTCCKT